MEFHFFLSPFAPAISRCQFLVGGYFYPFAWLACFVFFVFVSFSFAFAVWLLAQNV